MAQTQQKPAKKVGKVKRRYRLLRGKHLEGSSVKKNKKVYIPGSIVETTSNLLKLNGLPPMQPKFALVGSEAVDESSEAPDTGDGLEKLSTEQLLELAASEEIDIAATSNKVEIISAIRACQ